LVGKSESQAFAWFQKAPFRSLVLNGWMVVLEHMQ
jgi:hypothetical protein